MKAENVTALILAGGRSTRMGSCKAELLWHGQRLIDRQIEKMKLLGVGEILVSGYAGELNGLVTVRDVYPGKGPLSGIHAGLSRAKGHACLVTGIDTPLVPLSVLSELIAAHKKGITLLTHDGMIEPLMAVYDVSLAANAEKILQGDSTSVRRLFDCTRVTPFAYTGDPLLLCDCNTPEEYLAALQME